MEGHAQLALSEVEQVSELWHRLPACELTKHGQDGRATFERRQRGALHLSWPN
jgi:hypothetical protein